jgi:hypothetical protein
VRSNAAIDRQYRRLFEDPLEPGEMPRFPGASGTPTSDPHEPEPLAISAA